MDDEDDFELLFNAYLAVAGKAPDRAAPGRPVYGSPDLARTSLPPLDCSVC